MFHKIYDPLLTLVFPQACRVCGGSVEKSADGAACGSCWTKTQLFSGTETLCGKCGRFLSTESTNFETYCHLCEDHFYDCAISVGLYEHALAASVLNLKSEPVAAARLQNLFTTRFQNSNLSSISLLIPVPLSKKRLLERGFNQAEFLAGILAKKTGIKLDNKSLTRKIHTPMHRAAMDNKAREMSVKNAFEVKRPNLIKNENILLVDDVFTSGATVSACAKILKQSGARNIYVFTLAKTL